MVRSQEQKDRAKDKRLQRKFGITLADRDNRIRQQENKCKTCGGPLDPPVVDHYHFRIVTFRHSGRTMAMVGLKWYAQAYNEQGHVIQVASAKTQIAARIAVLKAMMPWSIRGILCNRCNRGLGYIERFFDAARHPENLLPVIEYFQSRLKMGII